MSNATLTSVDDADMAIKYTCSDGGAWMAETNNSTYDENTLHYTSDPDCSLSYTFTGVGIAILGERGFDRGIFSVTLDDGEHYWVNGNADGLQARWTLASIQGVANNSHTVVVQAGPLGRFVTAVDFLVVASAGGFGALGVSGVDGKWSSPYAYDPANIPASFLSDSAVTSPNSTNPSSTSKPAPPSSGSSISGGAGIGIGIAAILGVELLALLIWFLFKRKRSGSSHDSRTTKTSFTTYGGELPRSNTGDMTQHGPPSTASPTSGGALGWQHRNRESSLGTPVNQLESPASFAPRAAPGEL